MRFPWDDSRCFPAPWEAPHSTEPKRSREVPFALSPGPRTRLAQPEAGTHCARTSRAAEAGENRFNPSCLCPDRPHPPHSSGADILSDLSLSQCPDECGSCQHPPPRRLLVGVWSSAWLMKGARVQLQSWEVKWGLLRDQLDGEAANLGGDQCLAALSPTAHQGGRRWSGNRYQTSSLEEMPGS